MGEKYLLGTYSLEGKYIGSFNIAKNTRVLTNKNNIIGN
jgi:hypothetical protein